MRVRMPEGFPWKVLLDRFPDMKADGLHRSFAPSGSIVAEIRVRNSEDRDWSQELRGLPGVLSVVSLSPAGRSGTYRVRWKPPVYYPRLLEAFDMLGQVPVAIESGWALVSLALPRARLARLMRILGRRGFSPEILRLGPLPGPERPGSLTHKQTVRFQAAVENGYFEVPRRTTLEELARQFSVRKATFAESLAIARRKILVAAGRAVLSAVETDRLATPRSLGP